MAVSVGRFVGQPLRRVEDERILRGRSRFLDDVAVEGAAHVAFVRSPHARARIRGGSLPPRAPGLLAILTADDLAGTAPPRVDAAPGMEMADAPHPLLARDVRPRSGAAVPSRRPITVH